MKFATKIGSRFHRCAWLLCVMLVLLTFAVQAAHVHSGKDSGATCLSCVSMHSSAPVATIVNIVRLVAIMVLLPLLGLEGPSSDSSLPLFIRPPPVR